MLNYNVSYSELQWYLWRYSNPDIISPDLVCAVEASTVPTSTVEQWPVSLRSPAPHLKKHSDCQKQQLQCISSLAQMQQSGPLMFWHLCCAKRGPAAVAASMPQLLVNQTERERWLPAECMFSFMPNPFKPMIGFPPEDHALIITSGVIHVERLSCLGKS